jgi:chemotaxis protein methyltransferase CheR
MSRLLALTIKAFVPFVRPVWRRLPVALRQTRPARRIGTFFYDQYARGTFRDQTHYTWFLRNIAQLRLLNEVVAAHPRGQPLRIASIGCSVGAELYSTLWLLRRHHPWLKVVACGIDTSADVIEVARKGVYRLRTPSRQGGTLELDGAKVLTTVPNALSDIMDVTAEGDFRIKDWIREGVSWTVADATDPGLAAMIGPQDVVIVCNVLGPMDDAIAEACLRSLVNMIVPGGTLVLDGIDLDLKSRVTQSLGLKPVTRYLEEIHTADPTKRDWPWTRWSHEPIDYQRADWQYRYATVFGVASLSERRQESATDKPDATVAASAPVLAVSISTMDSSASANITR